MSGIPSLFTGEALVSADVAFAQIVGATDAEVLLDGLADLRDALGRLNGEQDTAVQTFLDALHITPDVYRRLKPAQQEAYRAVIANAIRANHSLFVKSNPPVGVRRFSNKAPPISFLKPKPGANKEKEDVKSGDDVTKEKGLIWLERYGSRIPTARSWSGVHESLKRIVMRLAALSPRDFQRGVGSLLAIVKMSERHYIRKQTVTSLMIQMALDRFEKQFFPNLGGEYRFGFKRGRAVVEGSISEFCHAVRTEIEKGTINATERAHIESLLVQLEALRDHPDSSRIDPLISKIEKLINQTGIPVHLRSGGQRRPGGNIRRKGGS